MAAQTKTLLAQGTRSLLSYRPGRELYVFALLALAALGLRLWELDGRAMHYDESLHVHYAWRMSIGEGYSHSPWMHGPFQVHLVAFIFKIFSDSDFTARLGYALFGSALVFLPYFLRNYLGRMGAIVTSVLLALSPSMLYFSRFGRNEILMAVFALALLILMWRYLNEGKNRYLYIASAVLALMFATKETAYIVVAIFGAALFLLSLTDLVPWGLGRMKLSEMRGPPVFLILLVTLTLPQWSALSSLLLGFFDIELIGEGVGEVGLPVWGAPFVNFPVVDLPVVANAVVAAAIVAFPVGAFWFTGTGRRWGKWLLPGAAVAAVVYVFFAFPTGFIARDYLISFAILIAALIVSAVIGLMWAWRVWLVCAAIFYTIWSFFYTSVFSAFSLNHGFCPGEVGGAFSTLCDKAGGVYTGSWQGLGYWLQQQEVARGGQPWYYHILLGSLYEFLPLLFGVIAIVYFVKKGDLFGTMLSFWAALTFVAYTVASERMPWLVVNLALPFILLAGMLIGDIIEKVPWRRVWRAAPLALLALPPLLLLAGVYLAQRSLDAGEIESWKGWGLLAAIVAMASAIAVLLLKSRRGLGANLASLGVAALLLGFSSFVAFRASYSYDDTPVEMLVYAQGSADIVDAVDTLGNGVFSGADGREVVQIDYELWYPMNWYVRHEQKNGTLGFKCYKDEKEDGYVDWCQPLEEPPSTVAILLNDTHSNKAANYLTGFEKSGAHKNLLWFPERYRRPGENRKAEGKLLGGIPSWNQLKKDFPFVKDNITSRKAWSDALDYFLYRRLDSNWWDSRFFAYISSDGPPEIPSPPSPSPLTE